MAGYENDQDIIRQNNRGLISVRGQRFQTGWGREGGVNRLEYGAIHIHRPVPSLRMTGDILILPLCLHYMQPNSCMILDFNS
jgi:hypothetical protein